jgi:catechol-2,3-dioxygenase
MIDGMNHITLTVSDLDQAFAFYQEVLGLKPLAKRKNKSCYFLAGPNWLALVLDSKKDTSCCDRSYTHLAFSVSETHFSVVSEKIKKSGAKIWQNNSSPGESLYFLDPSGNKLEIHSGSWQSRVNWLKENPSDEVTLFDFEGSEQN